MGNIWFISDTHFGHSNILNFTHDDDYLRPGFSDIFEMDEILIKNWNAIVKTNDKIYHLGDVCMCSNERMSNILGRLNGRKRLILGNHDDVKGTPLVKYFQKVSVWRIFKEHNFVCSHIPMNEEQFRMVEYNVHGHTHRHVKGKPYINVCVETRDYTPVHLDTLITEIKRLA